MIAIYIFGALLVVLLIGVTLAPLLEDEPPDVPLEDLPAEERRSAALEALRELEFEHETGKMTDDEYRRQRARYGRVALDALEEAESGGTEGAGAPDAERPAAGEAGAGAAPSSSEEIAGESPRTRCPSCGAAVRAAASYCGRCGARLEAGAGEST